MKNKKFEKASDICKWVDKQGEAIKSIVAITYCGDYEWMLFYTRDYLYPIKP